MTVPIPSPEQRLEALMKNVGDAGNCRGCAAPIKWITHKNGAKTPYDIAGETVGTNHFITCPKRENFKR